MTVYVSSGAFRARTVVGLLPEAERRGVTAIELSSGLGGGPGFEESLREAVSVGERFLVHNYFPAPEEPFVLNIASPDAEGRARSIAFAKEAIEIAAWLGAPFYSLHAGFALPLDPQHLGRPERQAALGRRHAADRDAALDRMLSAMIELSDHAALHDVRVLLENNVVSSRQLEDGQENLLLMADPAEADSFLTALGRSNVGLLLDVGHARVAGGALGFDPVAFFEACGHWIEALHLSDNDGIADLNQPFTESSWFYRYLAGLAALPLVVEVYAMDDETMAGQIALAERAGGQ